MIKHRKEKGLKKEELAKMANCSIRTIEYIENGRVKNPRLNTLIGLARALGIDTNEFIKL